MEINESSLDSYLSPANLWLPDMCSNRQQHLEPTRGGGEKTGNGLWQRMVLKPKGEMQKAFSEQDEGRDHMSSDTLMRETFQ